MYNTLENELERVINLAEYKIDYSTAEKSFADLTRLAAGIAGTDISLINLIDSYTQWTIANYGLDMVQMPRTDSVCQYTIMENDHFEVLDLSRDDRFKDKIYVTESPSLKYYYGIPLKSDGYNIGALCVLDPQTKTLSHDKIQYLHIIANEIIYRLKSQKVIESLSRRVDEMKNIHHKVAHDIRGPLSGIIGLTNIIIEEGQNNTIDDMLESNKLICKSSESIIELADSIMNSYKLELATAAVKFSLLDFKGKLEALYVPQAKSKNIHFSVTLSAGDDKVPFPINTLMQIAGNLIANAIKFTPNGGTVSVDLQLLKGKSAIRITVKDTGRGMQQEDIDNVMRGNLASANGTSGEIGYGFGLILVKHLISDLNGSLNIISTLGKGSEFEVTLKK
ncbi:MAG: GAF domain-containing sensor histidine kinase [Bacteroidetes bacterium]|nr:GAF domain-containing sensor histidine kinase [Bacteroidota bacterium]